MRADQLQRRQPDEHSQECPHHAAESSLAGAPRLAGALAGEPQWPSPLACPSGRSTSGWRGIAPKAWRDLRTAARSAHRRPHALARGLAGADRACCGRAKLVAAEIAARLPLARSTVSAVLAPPRTGPAALSQPAASPCGATSGSAPASWSMSTSRNWAASCGPAIASPAIAATPRAALAGNIAHVAIDDCSRFTYVEILPDEKRYTATAFWLRAVRAFRQRGIHRPTRAHRQRRRLPLAALSQSLPLARHRAPNARDPIAHRPTARPSASSRRCCASGPTPCRTPTPHSAAPRSSLGCASTTRNDPMLAFNRQTPISRLAQFAEQRS